ncbi:DUF262 domain-containing protein [Bibersteinia trehalosi]|uniref:DUF262 domain-containing protein n=1 Tax=Bibersteinia trehalosi TaxID=47735 RepID=UPI002D78E7DA|nr:DUF262 domain-containing HNH endonuclease family protein [Bibersteinia trehalosi]
MSITNFNTENNSFSKLISDRSVFKIPKYQRDYSWGNDEWSELWEDIKISIQEDSSHYMGYLVLQSVERNIFNVIDGQQRITTLSLVILAAMKNLKNIIDSNIDAENNEKRLNDIRARFIGYQDNITLINRNKLELNRNNNRYYKDYIVKLENTLPIRGFNESEHLLRKSFTFFYERIKDYISSKEDKGSEIAKLVENIVNNLFFTVITVTNELNAYKVFETLNARGVKLSSTDLLKNYLFSIVDNQDSDNASEELVELEDKWNRIISRLGNNNISDYLRTFWLSKHEFVRHIALFKTIKNKIRTREDAFRLINEMDRDLDAYLLCISPEDEPLTSCNSEEIQSSKLLKLFRIKQNYPLIIAAKRNFSEQEFRKVMGYLSIIAFRYTTIGNQPLGDPERTYFNTAQEIELGKLKNALDVAKSLKSHYLSDKEFLNYFKNKIIITKDSKNNKIARYIYSKVESKINQSVLPDISEPSITLEHILPQNPNSSWNNISMNDREKYIYHIGNMMLLEKSINKEIENHSFKEKLASYHKSSFEQVRQLANSYSEWTIDNIEKRSEELAKYAVQIWRIAGLNT